ncbi:hypothetical protein [Rhodococcus sp. ARC_M6]|uniref:hypothetical protein n=1 Tax=Rhodococcus sp. ARC_M6 TaxID=2928852 RepID=UPI0035B0EF1F
MQPLPPVDEKRNLVAQGQRTVRDQSRSKGAIRAPLTVKTHLVRVFGKLAVSDRTAAVIAAMKKALLDNGVS